MQENAKIWSANQVKIQRWLALPSVERKPNTQEELAVLIGVNPATLSRWKQLAGFMGEVKRLIRDELADDIADIYGALRKEAKGGSFQHIKLALELTGDYVQKIAPTTPDGKESVKIEYVNDWRGASNEN